VAMVSNGGSGYSSKIFERQWSLAAGKGTGVLREEEFVWKRNNRRWLSATFFRSREESSGKMGGGGGSGSRPRE
jgi:hypothetical protein